MVLNWAILEKGMSKACKQVAGEVEVGATWQWVDFWSLLSGGQCNSKC